MFTSSLQSLQAILVIYPEVPYYDYNTVENIVKHHTDRPNHIVNSYTIPNMGVSVRGYLVNRENGKNSSIGQKRKVADKLSDF